MIPTITTSSTFSQAIESATKKVVGQALTVSVEGRKKLAVALLDWLVRAPKKTVADLPDRMLRMQVRFQKLADELSLKMNQDGKIVMVVKGDSDDTYRWLVNGSDWFAPCPNLDKLVFNTLFG